MGQFRAWQTWFIECFIFYNIFSKSLNKIQFTDKNYNSLIHLQMRTKMKIVKKRMMHQNLIRMMVKAQISSIIRVTQRFHNLSQEKVNNKLD